MKLPVNTTNKIDSTEVPVENFEYKLIDSGGCRKLEYLGSDYYIIRPAPQAIWQPRLPNKKWVQAHAEFHHAKGKNYGGQWTFYRQPPKDGWLVQFRDLKFKLNLTNFGHVGLFPEQAPNWVWVGEVIKQFKAVNVLNIFGYTGAFTLMATACGAKVTHVDASRPTLTWARENQILSALEDKPVRWIVDDVIKFLKREVRRGNRYNGVIMDPPSFGRGPKGEVWKIEIDLPLLMQLCKNILVSDPTFILISTHSPGFSALTLENLLKSYLVNPNSGFLESGEMLIHDFTSGIHLPTGFYSRWKSV